MKKLLSFFLITALLLTGLFSVTAAALSGPHILRVLYRRYPHTDTLKTLTAQEALKVIETGDAKSDEVAQQYDIARYAPHEMDAAVVERLRKEAKV